MVLSKPCYSYDYVLIGLRANPFEFYHVFEIFDFIVGGSNALTHYQGEFCISISFLGYVKTSVPSTVG